MGVLKSGFDAIFLKKSFYSKIEKQIFGKLLPNSFSKSIPKLVLASQYVRILFFSIKKRKEKKIQTEESEAERDTFVKIDWLVSSSTA